MALRSDNTNNSLGDQTEYQHIDVLHPISQVLMSDVRKLRNEIVLSQTESGDAISALVIAIQLIKETCKKVIDAILQNCLGMVNIANTISTAKVSTQDCSGDRWSRRHGH